MSGTKNFGDNLGGKKQLNKNQLFRKQKVRTARTIRTEAIHASNKLKNDQEKSLSEDGGMIRIDRFINSRQFELTQLQYSMLKSKNANSTRVFQALPRKLRRRTASHNVRRIPKRMRNRALREMLKNDQQITIKNKNINGTKKKTHGLSSSQLYRARMSVKLLRLASKCMSMKLALPNNVTSSKCNVRQRIKYLKKLIKESKNSKVPISSEVNNGRLNNKCGSYDNTGINALAPIPRGRIKFCKRQRQFTWLPTHVWNAKRSHMIKRWGFNIPWSPSQKCFKLTHRLGGNVAASDGALCMDTSFIGTMVITNISEDKMFLKNLIGNLTRNRGNLKKYYQNKYLYEGLIYNNDSEIKESAILGPCNLLWVNEEEIILRLHPAIYPIMFNNLTRMYSKNILVQDCRYSLASITIRGAKSLTAISSILRSCKHSKNFEVFKKICNISDTNVLPSRVMFAMEVIDPRHLSAPKKIGVNNSRKSQNSMDTDDIIAMEDDSMLKDEFSKVLSKLTTSKGREESYNNQQTLKQLSKRRKELLKSKDTKKNNLGTVIPFKDEQDPSIPLLLIRRPTENDWLVIVPWFWHLPIWYQLNRVPRVYNMGLRQTQQLSYENKQLYFPDDYPFTTIGALENSTYKSTSLRAKWEKRAIGKKVNYEKLPMIHLSDLPAMSGEIGDYFSCDWKFLQIIQNGVEYLKQKYDSEIPLIDEKRTTQFGDKTYSRTINNFNDVLELYKDVTDNSTGTSIESLLPTIPIKLTNYRNIHKLNIQKFDTSVDITKKPLSVTAVSCVMVRKGHPKDNARIYAIPEKDSSFWKSAADGVYKSNGRLENDRVIPLPEIFHLIGFITSGTYHLSEGHGRGNGFIASSHFEKNDSFSRSHVLIRNVGTNVYRLAKIETINV